MRKRGTYSLASQFGCPTSCRSADQGCPKFVYVFRTSCRLSEKGLQISDMSDLPDLKTAILERIRADAPRKVWTPSDFVDLASRDAVDKALQRLTKAETLRRIDRGLYDQPGFNKLTQKPNPPDPRSVIDAVGRRDQTRMLVDGMTAANDLGLTDAVPAKIVVHTDARRRAIKLGNVTITFRPTAASKLFWAGRPAMRVVQALHWLRDLLVREGESDQVRRKLVKLFEDPTVGPPLKADLTAGMTALPTWMWVFLKPLVETDAGVHRRHVDDDRADADHDRHQQRTADDADDQRHAAVARPKRKPLSPQKAQTAKRGAARAVKT
ncbi:hypothetical protein RHODGE_RHODGE_01396 [Rhodoplanes serenus]|uniref:Uncharacterized protein n=2 Tax=Nitrobacteraceae TaxID=41294 RepID=A0A3S4AXQ5_9BRAD|nr:hypothetical protein RHODGE_RHODGE_01396 [Rhodoplanes serenus]